MENCLLSVIVPVYNVENYLEKCLESLVKQDLLAEQYEIIAINDGSTDKSGEILSNFAKRYTNIKVLTQENQGLSATRNRGVYMAQGDYIWFVDSDDRIKENCLKEIITVARNNRLDLLLVNLQYVDENKNLLYRPDLPDYSGKIINGHTLYAHLELSWNVCRYIINRQVILKNNLFFETDIIFEDGIYMDKLLYYTHTARIIYDYLYIYLKRNTSIVTSKINLVKKQMSFLQLAILGHQFMQSIENESYRKNLRKKIISYTCQYICYCTYLHKIPDRKRLKSIFSPEYKGESFPYKFRIFMIRYFPFLYGWVMRIKLSFKKEGKCE